MLLLIFIEYLVVLGDGHASLQQNNTLFQNIYVLWLVLSNIYCAIFI
jgi:hypothetical protein